MDIRQRVKRLLSRMHKTPQYPSQGAVLFVDLEQRSCQRGYMPLNAVQHFLAGRGGNIYLLYNLLQEFAKGGRTLGLYFRTWILECLYEYDFWQELL